MCPTGTSSHPDATKKSALRSAFEVLDVDHDGKISRDDLQTFYSGFSGTGESDEDILRSMMSLADSNKDGYVEYDEFLNVLDCKKNGGDQRNNDGRWGLMEDVFRVMDKDGDGKVGHDDLKNYLKWAGVEVGDDDIKAMIRLGGEDENGGVTYEGFLKILAV
ncbi:unnamed protein product [Ilex paraguariensis]|uniref:EF-hand domain-containing protein n=1 Tax=Ilex paraguariensis TaxID=185542 RepID=A0ABC8R257_9AQUA